MILMPLLRPVQLHIPDGFLNLPTALFFWAISIALVGLAARRTRGELGERRAPMMGVMAAFIFAAQMINFPVIGGTSGHLIGGALAAITLGPWSGMLVMTSVIGVQALLFQDGGLLVMGANIFNMGLLTAIIGYGLYAGTAGRRRTVRLAAAGVAAWLSVMAGALATSLQLWLSGVALLQVVLPAMLGVHALIGLGEALITTAALAFLQQVRPDLADDRGQGGRRSPGWVAAGLVASLVVVILSPLASADPDGLERVAIDLGFLGRSAKAAFQVFPDYTFPGFGNTPLASILAGTLGILVVVGIAVAVARLIQRSGNL